MHHVGMSQNRQNKLPQIEASVLWYLWREGGGGVTAELLEASEQ